MSVEKECQICGKMFLASRPDVLVCSEVCLKERTKQYNRFYYNERTVAKRKEKRAGIEPKPRIKTCSHCGLEFETFSNIKFCCEECRQAAKTIMRKEAWKKHKEELATRGWIYRKEETAICVKCGEPFLIEDRKGKAPIFCSRKECVHARTKEYSSKTDITYPFDFSVYKSKK